MRILSVLFLFVMVSLSATAVAQPQSYEPETAPPLQLPPDPEKTITPKVAPGDAMTISVRVIHSGAPKPSTPVFLRAARVRGPFEPTAPKPKYQWAGITDASGVATFASIPKDLAQEGLQVHAVATYGGLVFDSAAEAPSAGRIIDLNVYDIERGSDAIKSIRINKIRNTIELWEGYLVFRQTYIIENVGEKAFDTAMLVGEKYEKGLPIQLHPKAKGIKAFGAGQSLVINSIVFWTGVLLPKRAIQLQVHFSMSVKSSEFVYEQLVEYPTNDVEIVIPLQTQFQKLPRLTDLEMRPLEFEETERGPGIFGLRQDVDFVGAKGRKLEPGQSYKFQLRGLPYEPDRTPWWVLLGALISGLLVLVMVWKTKNADDVPKDEIRKNLVAEQDSLIDELVVLEQELADGAVTRAEYDGESLAIRERLALILRKLDELESK